MKIKVYILVIVLFLSLVNISFADPIYVNGHITENTTWTDTVNPYVLNGSLYIASGVTLTIASGVELQTNRYAMYIDGRLESTGGILRHSYAQVYGFGDI